MQPDTPGTDQPNITPIVPPTPAEPAPPAPPEPSAPAPLPESPVTPSQPVAPLAPAEPAPAVSLGAAAITNTEPLIGSIVVGGDAGPGAIVSTAPSDGPIPPAPAVPAASSPMPATPGRRSRKRWFIGGAAVVIIIIAGLGYYFGYYMSSSVVLSQSLSNTGKGYTKLVNYYDAQSKLHYKGATGSGSYKFKSGSTSTDGTLAFKSDGSDTDTTATLGLGVTRVTAELMTIKAAGSTTPDMYLKASGITGLGDLLGDSDLDSTVNQLDGKWISIDHTLLDNLASSDSVDRTAELNSLKNMPSQAAVIAELNSFGTVNQQYVFTTNKNKSVTTVLKNYGKQTVDGHTTYHYKMGFNKANLKQYLIAQDNALKSNSLGAWLKQNNYQTDVDNSFKTMEASTSSIKSSDTFDIWVDAHSRLIYKVRLSDTTNPATDYVDIGLNYKGGSSYPFFVNFYDKEGGSTDTGTFDATLDSKTNSLSLSLNTSGSNTTFSATATFKPSNSVAKITAPTGAESLSQVLDQLGLGSLLSSASLNAGQTAAADGQRKSDILALQVQLEAYYSQNNHYPSLTDMNNASWLAANMQGFDSGTIDPSSTSQKFQLVSSPTAGQYAYQVSNSSGASCESNDTQCTKYTLTATLSDGSKDTVNNLD